MSKDKSILEDIQDTAKSVVKKVEDVLDEIAADEKPHTITYDEEEKKIPPKKPEDK